MAKSWKTLLDRLLFLDKGILPTKRLVISYLVFSLILVFLAYIGLSWQAVVLLNVLFILTSLVDLVLSPSKNHLTVSREMPNELERGKTYDVTLEVKNTSRNACTYRIVDGLPQSFHKPFPLLGKVLPLSSVKQRYEIRAPIRGKYDVKKVYFRFTSTIGLWEKQLTVEEADELKVIPDLTEPKRYLEDAQRFLMYDGVRIRKQKTGEGEFSQVRNYVIGDDPRKINWRQTAKMQEVMANDLEPEHGKYITLLIDCGRMMGAELKEGNRLEKALEAAITVATAALKNGDYVSVVAFSKTVQVYVPPDKGMIHLNRILQVIYNVQVEAAESNYAHVMNYLHNVQKKRSLFLLFSDIHTFLHEESNLFHLMQIRKKHMFIMIGIEDELLLKTAKQPPGNLTTALMKSIAQQQVQLKKQGKAAWEARGLLMVETKEEHLATEAVSRYIQILNQGLL